MQNQNQSQNQGQGHTCFQDEQIIADVLRSEKQLVTSYGTYLAESTCENLRTELVKIIGDTQQLQYQVFDIMKQKGWYPVKNAQLTDVQTAVQKFQGMQQQLQ